MVISPIKSVHLKNIGCHKQLDIDLNPGFNVIVGPNRRGKSTILRSIMWALLNQKIGITDDGSQDAIIRIGSSLAKIKIIFADGSTIIREKGITGKPNRYIVNDKIFESVGKYTPDEVQKISRCSDLILPNENPLNLNYHGQLEKTFLLHLSGPSRARFFHYIAGSHLLEMAASLSNKSANSSKRQYNILLEKAQQIKSEIKPLMIKIKKAENALKLIEIKIKDLQNKQEYLNNLINIRNNLQSINKNIKQQKIVDKLQRQLEFISNIIDDGINILQKISNIKQIQNDINMTRQNKIHILQEIKTMEEKQKELENQIKSIIKIGLPCPFSGAPLPSACTEALK